MPDMTEDEQLAANQARYSAAAHAMQSGVAMEMNYRSAPTDPKHLRVGINVAMRDISSLVTLMISKGLFTEAEYVKALADGMEMEKTEYEVRLSELYGRKVTLV